jgi:hypothetical protein
MLTAAPPPPPPPPPLCLCHVSNAMSCIYSMQPTVTKETLPEKNLVQNDDHKTDAARCGELATEKTPPLSLRVCSCPLFLKDIVFVCRPSSVVRVRRLYLLSSHVSTLVHRISSFYSVSTVKTGVKNRLMFPDVTAKSFEV